MADSHREEIAKLEALYASNPGGRVFVHLAEAYRKAGELDRARRILTEGLAKHTDSASAYVVLGRVLADAGDGDAAATAFKRVLELDAGNLVAMRWLGDLARQAGRTAEARSYYRDLLARNPSNQEVQDLIASLDMPGASALAAAPARDDDTPVSAAPGRAGTPAPAEPEFGIVEISALPGDREPTSPEPDAGEDIIAAFEEEPQAALAEGADADPGLHAEPVAAHLLDAGLAASVEEEEPPFDFEDAVADQAAAEPATAGVELSAFELPVEEPDDASALDLTGFAEAMAEDAADFPTDLSAFIEAQEADEPDISFIEEQQQADETDALAEASVGLEAVENAAGADAELTSVELTSAELAVEFPGESTEDTAASELLEPQRSAEEEMQAGADDAAAAFDPAADVAAAFDLDSAGVSSSGADDIAADAFTAVERVTGHEAIDEAAAAFISDPDPLEAAVAELAAERAAAAELFIIPNYLHTTEPIEPMAGMQSGYAQELGGSAADEEDDRGLATETMAELYRAQGFTERAAEVYRTLVRRHPDDARLRARLREVEASIARRRDVESLVEEDESGEVWLRGVGAAWTGTPAGADAATPYAWTEAPEEAAGEPVGSFLRSLVSWRRPSAAVAEAVRDAESLSAGSEPEPLLLDETVVENATPLWQPSATPPTSIVPAAPAPESAEPWQTPAPPPAALAPSAPPTPTPNPLPPMPAGGPTGGRGATAVEAAFNEWYSGDIAAPADAAAPAVEAPSTAPSSPISVSAPLPSPPPAPPPAAYAPTLEPTSENGPEADDEDLEMFRSWLQSLKK